MKPRAGTCRECGHPVVYAHTEDEGLMVLEQHETAGGANRYAIWEDGMARPVTARAEVLAHQVHACPAVQSRMNAALT